MFVNELKRILGVIYPTQDTRNTLNFFYAIRVCTPPATWVACGQMRIDLCRLFFLFSHTRASKVTLITPRIALISVLWLEENVTTGKTGGYSVNLLRD